MRKIISAVLALFMVFSLTGCKSGGGGGGSGDSGASSTALDQSNVTLNFNFEALLAMESTDKDIMLAKIIDFLSITRTAYAAPLYDYVTTLYIKVTGDGMADIENLQGISDVDGSFSVTMTVPNGTDRRFYIELRDRNGNVLYSGETVIDIGDEGTSQDITIDVTLDDQITAEDYIVIGRGHLEEQKLELAFIAFDTAIGLDADHPVANFFRGFTKLLLLIQKDEPEADVTSPNADIASALNLYIYGNTADVYSSGDNIAPDIYDNDDTDDDGDGPDIDDDGPDGGYDGRLNNFFSTWDLPAALTTDDGVNLIENIILPEIDNILADLANAALDPVFYTTLTTAMHFDISSLIKVDIADIITLQAVVYGLKAYYNHILAYNLRTSLNWWDQNLDPDNEDAYAGLQDVLDRDNDNIGNLILVGSDTYLSRAKAAYSDGIDKLRSGLQEMDRRSAVNAEGHIFEIADDENIDEIIDMLDSVKLALNGPTDIDFNDEDNVRADLSKLFSSPDKDSLPEIYYHPSSGEELPILDTNDPSPGFDPSFGGILISSNGTVLNDGVNDIEDALREDILPLDYKFSVPVLTVGLTGEITDFAGIRPSIVDEEYGGISQWRDITDIYISKDDHYLYIGLKLRGAPYSRTDLLGGQWIDYLLYFNPRYIGCGWNNSPVIVRLHGEPDPIGWQFDLHRYGGEEAVVSALLGQDCSFDADGNIIEFKIPLDKIAEWVEDYQWVGPGEEWSWDGKELFVAASCRSNVSGESGDFAGDYLAELNIPVEE